MVRGVVVINYREEDRVLVVQGGGGFQERKRELGRDWELGRVGDKRGVGGVQRGARWVFRWGLLNI